MAKQQVPAQDNTESLRPPYVAYKAFKGFCARWKRQTLPDQIDNGVMPTGMDGTTRQWLRSSLKFLGLTDSRSTVTDKFQELVNAMETPQWKEALKKHILPAYEEILGNLRIENGTATQLDQAFRTRGKVDGQLLRKAVRFYLSVLRDAETPFSPHFAARRSGGRRGRKRNGAEEGVDQSPDPAQGITPRPKAKNQKIDQHAGATRSFPLYFRSGSGSLVVPADLTQEDIQLIELMIPVLKASAKLTCDNK
jgi:hypothetical protein